MMMATQAEYRPPPDLHRMKVRQLLHFFQELTLATSAEMRGEPVLPIVLKNEDDEPDDPGIELTKVDDFCLWMGRVEDALVAMMKEGGDNASRPH